MDLFEEGNSYSAVKAYEPFSARIAPKNLEDFAGQEHLIGDGGPLRGAVENQTPVNAIFFGPPGCGKTALARLIASRQGLTYVEFSCVTTGIAKIKEAIAQAEIRRKNTGKATLLVLDEIHHLNRTQQDVLLPYMESGVVCVIGMTTENPFFYIHRAVLSRALVFEFKSLSDSHLESILKRALSLMDKKGFELEERAQKYLISFANGDARKMLNALEFLTQLTVRHSGESRNPGLDPGLRRGNGKNNVDLDTVVRLLGQKQQLYDKNQDAHYNIVSAFIKSMRGSDPDAAIYWMAKMLEGGDDPRFIARRIVIAASEDVGNADPMALVVAQSAFSAIEMLGLPEGAIPLAHAAIYVASAPKSNAAYMALKAAQSEVEKGPSRPVPSYLTDSHTVGHQEGYKYAHDFPGHFVKQEYMPNPMVFYKPTDQGLEAKIKERLDFLWKDKKNSAPNG